MRQTNRFPAIIFILGFFLLGGCSSGGGSGDEVTEDVVDPIALDFVLALFTANGADWNDYLTGSDFSNATGDECNADTDTACVHGGEIRVVEATGKASCAGLTASDDLRAFDWVCDDSTGTARMISTGLAEGVHLSDLLDLVALGFKTNRVTVFDNGEVWGRTLSSTWWNNTVETTVPTLLGDVSTIYLLSASATGKFFIDADKISLVIEPGVTLSGPAGGMGSFVIQVSGRDYIWLEGNINATGDEIGVRLVNVSYSNLHNLTSNNASDGVWLKNSTSNNLLDINVNGNDNHGITLSEGSSNNTLVNVMASDCDNGGVLLDNVTGNAFNNVTSNNAITGTGITIFGSSDNTFENVTVNNNAPCPCGHAGIRVDVDQNGGLDDDVYSDRNSFTAVTAIGNDVGIWLTDSSDNTFKGLNVAGNITTNCSVDQPTGTEGARTPGDPGLDVNCLATITDNPTDPNTVFSLFPSGYLTPGYQESYLLSGTSSSSGDIAGTLLKQTQTQLTFLGEAAVPINENLDLTFSTGSISLPRTEYYSSDINDLRYLGTSSTISSMHSNIPSNGLIGDAGPIGDYFDGSGNATFITWRLGDAGGGRANLIFSSTIYSDPNTIASTQTDSYLIDPNGDRVSLSRISYNPLFGGVTVNISGDNIE